MTFKLHQYSGYLDNFFRSFPFVVPAVSMGYGLVFHQRVFVYYTLVSLTVDLTVYTLKKHVFRPLYQYLDTNQLPLLGRGTRPDGANNCGWFIDCDNQDGHGYGMPSGHAASAFVLAMFWSLYLLDTPSLTGYQKSWSVSVLYLIASGVAYSRYRIGCHTVQQIILGSVVGSGMGYLAYQLWRRWEPVLTTSPPP